MSMPNWYGVFAPKGTPQGIVDRLGTLTKEVMNGLDQAKLTQMSMAAAYQGPAEFKKQIAKDDALLKDVIQKANVKVAD
jgi:tripartite-type tricarboxylate transporter receptor subunit TctC